MYLVTRRYNTCIMLVFHFYLSLSLSLFDFDTDNVSLLATPLFIRISVWFICDIPKHIFLFFLLFCFPPTSIWGNSLPNKYFLCNVYIQTVYIINIYFICVRVPSMLQNRSVSFDSCISIIMNISWFETFFCFRFVFVHVPYWTLLVAC